MPEHPHKNVRAGTPTQEHPFRNTHVVWLAGCVLRAFVYNAVLDSRSVLSLCLLLDSRVVLCAASIPTALMVPAPSDFFALPVVRLSRFSLLCMLLDLRVSFCAPSCSTPWILPGSAVSAVFLLCLSLDLRAVLCAPSSTKPSWIDREPYQDL